MSWIVGALVGLLVFYILAVAAAAYLSVFPMRTPQFVSPGFLGSPQENVRIEPDKGPVLTGWFVDTGKEEWVAVYGHGYLMNRSEFVPLAHELAQHGVNALLFDFRAHGRSEGRKASMGWFEREDVVNAIAEAKRRKPNAKVLYVGSSMGAVAGLLAGCDDPDLIDAYILDAPYASLKETGKRWFTFLAGPAAQLILAPAVTIGALMAGVMPGKVDMVRRVTCLDRKPMLFLAAENDVLVPIHSARRLASAAGRNTQFVEFPDTNHGEPRLQDPVRYRKAVFEFLQQLK